MDITLERLRAELESLELQLKDHATKSAERQLASDGEIMTGARLQEELRDAIAAKQRALAAARQQIGADTAAEQQRVTDDRRNAGSEIDSDAVDEWVEVTKY